jgi:putative membrane protein
VAPVVWRFRASGIGEDLVVGRTGLWNRRTHAVPHARVQSVQVHQGPVQRRLGLADLRVDSPPGPVRVRARHRDADEVRRWLDRESHLTRRARRGAG